MQRDRNSVQIVIEQVCVSVWSKAVAAGAIVLARDLDNPGLATSHASRAKQSAASMDGLRRGAEPRRGRLAVVQRMGDRA
ncbi:MAG: hypothetical protein JOZ49_23545 [Mycolicibacterium sp.]|nr:hypothetical protein [Mycolicibacterium sp.]